MAADLPGTRALATASHSIAATLGYEDGQHIPVDLMIDMCGRIAAAVDLPVSADLEGGYGDPGETVRKAIGAGIVGANLEDEMRPLADAVAGVEAAVAAGRPRACRSCSTPAPTPRPHCSTAVPCRRTRAP